LVVLDT